MQIRLFHSIYETAIYYNEYLDSVNIRYLTIEMVVIVHEFSFQHSFQYTSE